MQQLQEFTGSLKFIITFLVFVLLLSMFTTEKFTQMFLTIVLFSMVILNHEKVGDMIGGFKLE